MASGSPGEYRVELLSEVSRLIPGGEPDFAELANRSSLKDVAKVSGKSQTIALISLMVKNFCSSLNIVRSMNQDQLLECAIYLMDECRDFTMEDYLIMFTMAKRGKLGTVMDHVDIKVIADIHLEYIRHRQAAFKTINDSDRKRQREAHRDNLTAKDLEAGRDALATMNNFVKDFVNKEKIEDQNRINRNVSKRNAEIIKLVEDDAMNGIGPDKFMQEYYFKAIGL